MYWWTDGGWFFLFLLAQTWLNPRHHQLVANRWWSNWLLQQNLLKPSNAYCDLNIHEIKAHHTECTSICETPKRNERVVSTSVIISEKKKLTIQLFIVVLILTRVFWTVSWRPKLYLPSSTVGGLGETDWSKRSPTTLRNTPERISCLHHLLGVCVCLLYMNLTPGRLRDSKKNTRRMASSFIFGICAFFFATCSCVFLGYIQLLCSRIDKNTNAVG